MRKFIPVVFVLSFVFGLIGYAYCKAPAVACLFQRVDSLILPQQQDHIVSFGADLRCKTVGNQPCSAVWYRLIVDANNNPVYWNADVIGLECGGRKMFGCNVSVNQNWFGNGYKASQMIYDEANWIEIVTDGPVPLN